MKMARIKYADGTQQFVAWNQDSANLLDTNEHLDLTYDGRVVASIEVNYLNSMYNYESHDNLY